MRKWCEWRLISARSNSVRSVRSRLRSSVGQCQTLLLFKLRKETLRTLIRRRRLTHRGSLR